MKILLICCSDILGMPVIVKLQQEGVLSGIAMTDRVAGYLIPIYQNVGVDATNLHILTKRDFPQQLTQLITLDEPTAILVLAFAWTIPPDVLNLLPGKFINLHFGLLPKYRGADPVFWSLRNNEQRHGVTAHLMSPAVDEGPVLMEEIITAIPGEIYSLLSERLSMAAAALIARLIPAINIEVLNLTAQHTNFTSKYFKKPSQQQLTINWHSQTADDIELLVNAANPRYMGASTTFRHMPVQILEVARADMGNLGGQFFEPGVIIHADQLYGIIVACIQRQFLKINIVSLKQGFYSGSKLFSLGFKQGEVFGK
ncbi:MAG: methionyl-tRNA formyltransferase [Mucilaginibacter sp.]